MDQNKNPQGGQQSQGQGQPTQGSKGNANRDPAEGSRDDTRGGSNTSQPTGAGKQRERNFGGISNRGMGESEEQADLPERGSGQSER